MRKLPVIGDSPGCTTGGCSTCSTGSSCGTGSTRSRGVFVAGALLAVCAIGSLGVALVDARKPKGPPAVAMATAAPSPVAPPPAMVQAPAAGESLAAGMPVAARLTPMWQPVTTIPTWIPTITRSALLPHLFAGICMNCHAVLGEFPAAPIDPSTPGLSPVDQELVRAGQRVLVPTPLRSVKAPLIGRESILPHDFQGECSNCHAIVQAGSGASAEFMARGLEVAHTRLFGRGLSDAEVARAQVEPPAQLRRIAMIGAGIVALALFLVSMVYVVMKSLIKANPERYRKRFNVKKWFRIHEWTSVGLGVAAVAHWLLSVRGNAFLHLSLILLVGLVVSGVAYRSRALKAQRKSMRWLHTQRTLTYVLVALAVFGHLLIGQ